VVDIGAWGGHGEGREEEGEQHGRSKAAGRPPDEQIEPGKMYP
jgi:hypothetical protein